MNFKSNGFGYFAAVLSALCFGSVTTLAKPTLAAINPLVLTCIVYLVSAIALTPATVGKKTTFQRKDFLKIIVIAIAGAVIAPLLFFSGLRLTSASNTAVLSNVEIVFTVIIAILFFKEKINRVGYIGLAMVTVGATVVTGTPELTGITNLDIGSLMVIGSSLFWAIDNNISKVITKKVDVLKIAQFKSGIGGLILLIVVFAANIPILIPSNDIPFILLLGIVGFALSLFLFLKSLHIIGVVKTIVIFATSSVFGLIFAILFLHEKISEFQISAICVMIIGIYLINRKGQADTSLTPP
ncbi:MAG: DMT family transporter [Thaumarchaeota archaeon]|nr:DMT family transporter [Nitrososphaerota archaeon]MDE1843044.1 DMT family transporter [Nitrososphaerota archaeon]